MSSAFTVWVMYAILRRAVLQTECCFVMCSNQLRQTQSTLEDSGGTKFVDIIGDMQEEFTFEVLQKKNGMSVSSASCSALTGHVDELRSFIRRCVPS